MLDLIYTGHPCYSNGERCQSGDDRPFICCHGAEEQPSDRNIIVAYFGNQSAIFNQEVTIGQVISIPVPPGTTDPLNIEIYPNLQVMSFHTSCENYNIGCFTGFGQLHVAGWENSEQGKVNCPFGVGTQSLDVTINVPSQLKDISNILYAELSTKADYESNSSITSITWDDKGSNSATTKVQFGIQRVLETTYDATITVFGLTDPYREVCQGRQNFQLSYPRIRPKELCGSSFNIQLINVGDNSGKHQIRIQVI